MPFPIKQRGGRGGYHYGLRGVHGQATDRHEVALEGLGQVESLHIHWGEGEAGHWVGACPPLHSMPKACSVFAEPFITCMELAWWPVYAWNCWPML